MGDIVPSGKTIGSPGGKKILCIQAYVYCIYGIKVTCERQLEKAVLKSYLKGQQWKKKKKIKKHSFKLIGFSYVYGTQLPP